MNALLKRTMALGTILVLFSILFSTSASADITSVTRTGTPVDGECVGSYQPIFDGAEAYCDRVDPTYTYTGFPQELVDVLAAGELVEYVVVPVDARADDDYGLEMTVDSGGTVLLLVPDSVDVETQLSWAFGSYTDIGLDLTLDKVFAESGFDPVNMNIWARDTDGTAGETIVFGPQGAGDNDALYAVMYASDLVDIQVVATNLGSEPVTAGVADDWHIELVASNNGPGFAGGVVFEVEITLSEANFLQGCSILPTDGDGVWYPIDTILNPDGSVTLLRGWDIGPLDPGQFPKVEFQCAVNPGVSEGATAEVKAELTAVDEKDTDDTNNSDSVLSTIQRVATWDVEKVWDGGEVDVQLTCDGQLVDSATTSGKTATLTHTAFADNVNCVVTETVPAGQAPTYVGDCDVADTTSGLGYVCIITNEDSLLSIEVSKSFSDGNTASVDVTLECNGGFISQGGMATISEGDGHTFVVTRFIDGELDCSVTESGGPAGYTTTSTPSPCEWSGIFAADGPLTCAFVNTAINGTFTVSKVWEDLGGPDSEVEEITTLQVDCTRDIVSATPSCTSGDANTCVWENVEGDVNGVLTIDNSQGSASCTVSEPIVGEGVEASGCETAVTVSAGSNVGCTITNTVFFEGIPTLSQYGLAIMALLMLGIGLVGFRRFA